MADDWNAFAMELWGLSVATWTPIPEREGKLPEPLEYDTLHDGLVELEAGQRQMVIQCMSCYQVNKTQSSLLVMTYPNILCFCRPGKYRRKMFFKYCVHSDRTVRHLAQYFKARSATLKAKLRIFRTYIPAGKCWVYHR